MASNYGKKFESKFKEDWQKMEDAIALRLIDVTMGYKSIRNVCDFVAYKYPFAYFIETKSCQGNTFNFGKLTQYDDLIQYINVPGLNPAVVIWFTDHEKVCYVPLEEVQRLKKLNYKSIHVKMIGDEQYNVFEILGKLKRVYIDTDYTNVIKIAQDKFDGKLKF